MAIVSNDELRTLRGDLDKKAKNATREAAILTAADIARMKAGAKVTTETDAAEQKRILEE